jgi:hypothetical protein
VAPANAGRSPHGTHSLNTECRMHACRLSSQELDNNECVCSMALVTFDAAAVAAAGSTADEPMLVGG